MNVRPVVDGEPEPIHFEADAPLAEMYLLSPFVWREDGQWRTAVRAVPRSERAEEKVSRVHLGRGLDGVHFALDGQAAIGPGPDDDDSDGCEDPTVVRDGDGYRVFYSGWNQQSEVGQLLSATAADDHGLLDKQRRVLPQPSRFVNAKEASLVEAGDGSWRLLFEYAVAGRSAVGIATSPSLGGPWAALTDPFVRRPGRWDDVHLSPGPAVMAGGAQFVFYNGANDKTQWRIGWVQLDTDCTTIISRGEEALIVPPPVTGDNSDIAFCSSAVKDDAGAWLYYTVSDQDPFRVRIAFHS